MFSIARAVRGFSSTAAGRRVSARMFFPVVVRRFTARCRQACEVRRLTDCRGGVRLVPEAKCETRNKERTADRRCNCGLALAGILDGLLRVADAFLQLAGNLLGKPLDLLIVTADQ